VGELGRALIASLLGAGAIVVCCVCFRLRESSGSGAYRWRKCGVGRGLPGRIAAYAVEATEAVAEASRIG